MVASKKSRRGKTRNVIVRLAADVRRRLGQIGILPVSVVSGANAAGVITIAADAAARFVLHYLNVSYSAVPTGGRITVTDGGTTIVDLDITVAGPVVVSLGGAGGAQGAGKNRALVATIAAGGAAIVGKIALGYEPVM